MGLKRRTFLQRAGLTLAALGVSEIVLSLLGDKGLAAPLLDRYFQALAQPTGRKLALLVGINQYPHSVALGGCVTDVELQRELLIHRFGFNASDILTLTDSQATRENIETAFLNHLSDQAKAGDVVVFHFSGYGSRVKITQDTTTDQVVSLSNSLVPVDGIVSTKGAPVANDLLEETLVLLLRSLATDQITTVLDTSHNGVGSVLQGNIRVRSCPNPPAESPSPEEVTFQSQLLHRLNVSLRQRLNSDRLNQMPGIVLAAAGPSQLATEAQWNGFSAGLFTYALTQYLWQAAPTTTVQISLSRAAGMVNQLVGKEQYPQLMGQKSLQQPLLAYYLTPDPRIGADGVVTAVEDNGKTAQLWLAGLPATVLDYYGINSLLSLFPSKTAIEELNVDQLKVEGHQGNPQSSNLEPSNLQPSSLENPQLQIRSKEGLTARARMVNSSVPDSSSLQVGQLVQEVVRVLPRHLGLTIALDANLERIERVDATSAFASIPSVSSVVTAGEQAADYLFGKVILPQPTTLTTADSLSDSVPLPTEVSDGSVKTGGYGLFYLARDPIRNTVGEAGEAVKSAVKRLSPKLRTLLAAKLLRLTANEGSSRLGIRASLEMVTPEKKVVMRRETLRASSSKQTFANAKPGLDLTFLTRKGSVPTIPVGSHIRYRLENYSDRPIYFMMLGFDTNGNAIALYQNQSSQTPQDLNSKLPLKSGVIAPGEILALPKTSTSSDWVVPGPTGLAEIQLICSQSPLTKTLLALEAARRPTGEGDRMADLFNPLDVAQAVLQDLHSASAIAPAKTTSSTPDTISTVSDTYALDVNAWATLSFIYQVA